MKSFINFRKQLLHNYIFGSILAVLGVGGIFIYFTLSLSAIEFSVMAAILVISFFFMLIIEYLAFSKDIEPILKVYEEEFLNLTSLRLAFTRLHSFPILTFKRIMVPHLIGLSAPAVILASASIHMELLSIPYSFVFFAMIGAILVAGMHGIIEFFLTIKAIQPLLKELSHTADKRFSQSLSLEGKSVISIKRKFQLSFLYITVFPILLFGLATQVKLDILRDSVQNYWSWAAIVIFIGLAFAYFGSKLLFLDINQPIVQLQNSMKNIQEGSLTAKTDELYSDEFAGLVSGFNHMVDAINIRDQQNQMMFESFLESLSAALDARDPYTAGHSGRVAAYSLLIGEKYGLSEHELSLLKKSAILHDIGKIGISDKILQKDSKLTDEEFAEIKKHPVVGANIVRQVQGFTEMEVVIEGIMYHHERYDGRGYPTGISGTAIPLFGRIISVADAFDAMTSNRPYRNGMAFERALKIIEDGMGSQWDPVFAGIFVELMRKTVKSQKAIS
ncbi:HD domain-containing protein [Bacillus sp. ISL-41]|uniref:HD domain-containing phosphohydrolase n=1 Tax=Bacillus sp. ISL-41 TaxID=2819127 RepID=UPI001BE90363|nr:HD domain-containing phosphohydrolase [Bacillus sp. ISL-41]MBT2641262.1 HD domain-containing protein [Bacillus sp. ISL-41]